jgi:ABC-type uncharacterized transport system involved in gliding motility auxiliary subunit
VAVTEAWTGKGKAAAWTNVALQAVLLAAALFVANLIAAKVPKRFDLTSRRTFSLTNASEDALRGLTYDLTIWLNKAEYEATGDKALRTALVQTEELLLEIQKRSPRIAFHRMSPAAIPRRELFLRHFTVLSPTTVYLLASLEGGRANKKVVSVHDLFEGNSATGDLTAFRGEGVLLHALRELGGSTKRIVYQTEGHQEILMEDASRMKILSDTLTRNEGVEIRRFPTLNFKSVPPDCDILLVLGPGQPFNDQETGILRDYLERGGSLLVAVRARVRTGLEPLLEEYGARVGDNFVLDPVENFGRWTELAVYDFIQHPINRTLVAMTNVQFAVPDSATVEPVNRGPSWSTVPLMRSGSQSWEEKGEMGAGKPTPRMDGDERPGPLPLVVAVEKPASKPQDARHAQARLLVWGSVTPFTNPILRHELQRDYVVNCFRWLAGRELMGIEARRVSVKPLDMKAASVERLKWAVIAGFPSVGVLLGLVVWFMRRK